MDPVSIVAAAFSLAGGIAKATTAITQFTRSVQSAAKDLDSISKELQALNGVLDPLARSLSRRRNGSALPDSLIHQIGDTLDGCDAVVTLIIENVQKYQRDTAWTKAKWVMFGQDDVLKLRESLEAYKMALSLGFHAISMCALFTEWLGYC